MPLTDIGSYTLKYLQILDETGKVDKDLEPKLTKAQLLELYKSMALARAADDRQLKLQRQGRMGTFGPATGQEAAACGPTFAMNKDDWFVGAFRELGARLMRGVKLSEEYLFWNGFEEGNVTPDAPRTLPNTVIVASQCTHAVGLAYAMKYRKEKSAVVCFLGDGATSQGEFHEAMNFATVWQVPVVFICQNNQWAISVPRSMQSYSKTLAQKGFGYDMECLQVDGNDVLATYSATKDALDRARSGGGPTFIEAVTFRLMMHTTADDPTKYRDKGVEEEWWKKDPLPRFRKYLEERKVLNDTVIAKMDAEIKAIVDQAVKELEAPREYEIDAPFDHLYATPHPYVEAQREEFLNMLKEEEAEKAGSQETAHA
jgi:pyruvate dehydrogenase E1 component alpha subunit